MIDGNNIRLRAWREDDVTLLIAMRNDVDMQAQLLARVRGSNAKKVLSWLKDTSDRLLFIISDRSSDVAIGYLQVAEMDMVSRNAVLGICLVSDARGHGFSVEAINLVCNYLCNIWGIRKLSLRLRADNTSALRCYEKACFERCGLLKQHFFLEGRWLDIVLMERLLCSGADE